MNEIHVVEKLVGVPKTYEYIRFASNPETGDVNIAIPILVAVVFLIIIILIIRRFKDVRV